MKRQTGDSAERGIGVVVTPRTPVQAKEVRDVAARQLFEFGLEQWWPKRRGDGLHVVARASEQYAQGRFTQLGQGRQNVRDLLRMPVQKCQRATVSASHHQQLADVDRLTERGAARVT